MLARHEATARELVDALLGGPRELDSLARLIA
jgi:hypothetical protein